MNAAEILVELREKGVRVTARPGGKVKLSPGKLVSPEWIEIVRTHKADLLRLLQDHNEAAPSDQVHSAFPGGELVGTGAQDSPNPAIELVDRAGFHCSHCLNNPAQCAWCAEHINDPGVLRCGDCEEDKQRPAHHIHDREEDEIDRLARVDGWQPSAQVAPAVAAEIHRIEAQALQLGWDHGRLWNLAFWPNRQDEPRGLASILSEGDEIVDVSADGIAILANKRIVHWFPRRAS